jgi:hypothetical protein
MGCSTPNTRVAQGPDMHGIPATRAVGVHTPLSDGAGITALINKSYNEDTTSCVEYGTGATRGY